MKCAVLILLTMVVGTVAGQIRDAKPEDSSRDREALLKLADEIVAAKAGRDTAVLGRVLADDYIFTNPAGLVADKTEHIDGAKADTAKYESVVNQDVTARVYGGAAVVTGETTVKGQYDGKEIGGRFRFTSTFIKRATCWQCVATQLTRISL